MNLYSLLVYIEHNGDESPKILKKTFAPVVKQDGDLGYHIKSAFL